MTLEQPPRGDRWFEWRVLLPMLILVGLVVAVFAAVASTCTPTAHGQGHRVPESSYSSTAAPPPPSVPPTRLITTTSPISGGRDLASDLTLACPTCAILSPGTAQAGFLNVTGNVQTGANFVGGTSVKLTDAGGDGIYVGSGGSQMLFQIGNTTRLTFGNTAITPTDFALNLGGTNNRFLSMTAIQYQSGSGGVTLQANGGDGASAAGVLINQSGTSYATTGASAIENAVSGSFHGYWNLHSGRSDVWCDGATMRAGTAGINAVGDAVCWSGSNMVITCPATANLTTIAGVALSTATNGNLAKVCQYGRVIMNCETTVTAAGMLLGTSGTTAGRVGATAPGSGALLGRSADSVNQMTEGTNKCIIDIIKG